MKSLQSYHPNIVRLLGCCTKSDPVCIILELAPYGNLKNFLLANRSTEIYQNLHQNSRYLTSLDLIHFGWQIAKGMSFIASKKFIHRDLAARNILLGEKRCCKISDFGFARDVSTASVYHSKLEGRLPIRWMALESVVDSLYTIKSDVWSYGIVLWEIVTLGSTPYANMSSSELIRKLPTGYRLPRPDHCSEKYYGIMSRCWDEHSESRPSFSDLSVVVGKMSKDTTEEYMTMENFDSNMYVNITSEQWPLNERM
ncbi:tyrosine kinase receptor Cad96Ca-like [Ptychodera flava]|uniref:tyrosine kinase receptor Cad96Ca-like n=1 Tax=Ptychodera flava TaxID=63121 RepID=UPI003969C10B